VQESPFPCWRNAAACDLKTRYFLGFSPLIPAVWWTLWPVWPYRRGRREFEHLHHHQRRRQDLEDVETWMQQQTQWILIVYLRRQEHSKPMTRIAFRQRGWFARRTTSWRERTSYDPRKAAHSTTVQHCAQGSKRQRELREQREQREQRREREQEPQEWQRKQQREQQREQQWEQQWEQQRKQQREQQREHGGSRRR